MAQQTIDVAVLFVDVSGSTQLYDTLGDEVAKRIIDKFISMMTVVTRQHGGHVIKTIGDEVMSRFDTANEALRAAQDMQEEISMGLKGETVPIQVKVGAHFGPAIPTEGLDVFGDAVNIASRMAGIAKGSQIITTHDTIQLLEPSLQDMCREFDRASVRGKEDEIVIYQMVWEKSDDVTRIEIPTMDAAETKDLRLTFRGQEIRISSTELRTFIIGRGAQSDLLCQTRLASRAHATIEFNRGNFMLIDQSSNGTFVKTDDGDIFLRRQQMMLWGSGTIALGEEIDKEDPDDLISFECN
ncbi:MAG: adenylate/guanylate cyclase domain-containing protein [Pseudomonadota bacterium]